MSDTESVSCPICGEREGLNLYWNSGSGLGGQAFTEKQIAHCESCGTRFYATAGSTAGFRRSEVIREVGILNALAAKTHSKDKSP